MILSLGKYQRHIPFETTMTTALATRMATRSHDLLVSILSVQRILSKGDWLVYITILNTLPLKVAHVTARKTKAKDMLLQVDAGTIWRSIRCLYGILLSI